MLFDLLVKFMKRIESLGVSDRGVLADVYEWRKITCYLIHCYLKYYPQPDSQQGIPQTSRSDENVNCINAHELGLGRVSVLALFLVYVEPPHLRLKAPFKVDLSYVLAMHDTVSICSAYEPPIFAFLSNYVWG